MCSACAERDVHFSRDVCFASDVRFAREKRSTSHHFAAKPQNIIAAQAATSLAPSAQTSQSLCVIMCVSLGTVNAKSKAGWFVRKAHLSSPDSAGQSKRR
jgi:hypothetical protein